jgi:hypothetical protein
MNLPRFSYNQQTLDGELVNLKPFRGLPALDRMDLIRDWIHLLEQEYIYADKQGIYHRGEAVR